MHKESVLPLVFYEVWLLPELQPDQLPLHHHHLLRHLHQKEVGVVQMECPQWEVVEVEELLMGVVDPEVVEAPAERVGLAELLVQLLVEQVAERRPSSLSPAALSPPVLASDAPA